MRLPIVTFIMFVLTATLVACGSAKPATPLPQPGSFSAFCAAIHVRFLAPPRVMQDESACRGNNLFLTTNVTDDTGVEFLTVFRYTGDARGQTAAGWADILESFRTIDAQSGDTAWSAASPPAAQAVPGAAGFSGGFTRTDKGGVRYAGSLWAGAVGDDTVVVLGQGSADRQAILGSDMAQVLRTIDVNAQ